MICAPQEHASQTYPLFRPPSSSPQRWCSRTNVTKAARVTGMGPGDYHSVNAPGYHSLDSIRRTAIKSSPFLPHHRPVLRGGGGPWSRSRWVPDFSSSTVRTSKDVAMLRISVSGQPVGALVNHAGPKGACVFLAPVLHQRPEAPPLPQLLPCTPRFLLQGGRRS